MARGWHSTRWSRRCCWRQFPATWLHGPYRCAAAPLERHSKLRSCTMKAGLFATPSWCTLHVNRQEMQHLRLHNKHRCQQCSALLAFFRCSWFTSCSHFWLLLARVLQSHLPCVCGRTYSPVRLCCRSLLSCGPCMARLMPPTPQQPVTVVAPASWGSCGMRCRWVAGPIKHIVVAAAVAVFSALHRAAGLVYGLLGRHTCVCVCVQRQGYNQLKG